MKEIQVKFSAYTPEFQSQDQHSPIETVEGRVKRVGSILDKAARKKIIFTNFDELADKIEDIAGVRIICRFVEDIEKVVVLVRERHGVDLRVIRERDYINQSKPSGYSSYHIHIGYTVMMRTGPKDILAEIQIRTMAMNFWATIEHSLKYKYNGQLPESLQHRLAKSAEAAHLLDREMGVIREEIVEAHRIIERRNDLIDKILRNIKALYLNARLEKIDELNREFIILSEENNLEKLNNFNQRLRTMAQLYQVECC